MKITLLALILFLLSACTDKKCEYLRGDRYKAITENAEQPFSVVLVNYLSIKKYDSTWSAKAIIESFNDINSEIYDVTLMCADSENIFFKVHLKEHPNFSVDGVFELKNNFYSKGPLVLPDKTNSNENIVIKADIE
ncbi:hypothetical protein J7384_18520 [Endozoicomonas sp. G2_1]|uniref:hypothetical protein n=1 Tax=Endozoicomonas sp. G2_1 TaxID=2821091 RepID=UPI001ADBBCD6|nr:hypothetical protein [Endozoicomonas sp. G2_1]MBO9492363.1 hypothetical protein [Endozoicomonas sp. G2_1]